MIYLCDICLGCESVSLVTLLGRERLLALKLVNARRSISRSPLKSCTFCFKKLQFFKRRIILNLKYKRINMHYPNYPPKDNEQQQQQNQYFDIPELNVPPLLTSDQETRVPFYDLKEPLNTQTDQYLLPAQCDLEVQRPVGSCTDDYNCQCDSCQNKYGDLPILLQGIEQKNFNEKTDPQPSTSSQSSSKKILTCEYCRKTFTHKGDFNKHLRKHTKEKPFSCRICSRKFGHTSNLLRHQRLHSGEKPFACDNCDKRFSRKDKLDCHKRSRTCQVSNNAYQSYQ